MTTQYPTTIPTPVTNVYRRRTLKITDIKPELLKLEQRLDSRRQFLGFNVVYGDKKGWLIFSLPEVKTLSGIKRKKPSTLTNDTKEVFSFTIVFDPSNPSNEQAYNAWNKLFERFTNLVRDNCETLAGMNDTYINKFFPDPTYLSGKVRDPAKNKVQQYGYTMYLKLLNYEKSKAHFFTPSGKVVNWSQLESATFSLIPTIAICGIHHSNNMYYLIVRLYSAIITSKVQNNNAFDPSLLNEYNVKTNSDEVDKSIEERQKAEPEAIKDDTVIEEEESDTIIDIVPPFPSTAKSSNANKRASIRNFINN
jgi:hypothetical protein